MYSDSHASPAAEIAPGGMAPPKQAYSLAEVEHMLGLSKNTVRALVYSDPPRIRSVRVGRRVLVPRSAVDEFLEAESAAGVGA